MSTTESIASSQTSLSSWRKSDTTWTLGLFGTAIGAGVLFFPIRAGFGGPIPSPFIAIGPWPGYACRGLTPPAISPKRWKSILAKPAGW